MKKGKDISAQFSGLYLVHQNLPGKKTTNLSYNQRILFLPLQGEIVITMDNQKVSFGLGHMFYLPPGTKHSFSSSEKFGERLIVMFEPNFLPREKEFSRPVKLPLNQFIKEMLFYLLLHPKTKSARSLVSVFSETLRETIEESQTRMVLQADHLEARSFDSRVKDSLAYMQENLSENLNMNDVAKIAGLSLRNFNRLFIKETGLQPKKWLIHYRIEKAMELLKQPGASVTDVTFSVGYNSLGQFISAFRARTGQLPSEFLRHG